MDWLNFNYNSSKNTLHIKNSYIKYKNDSSALEIAIDTINKIISVNPGPYVLMCSGGIDSQAMAYAWKCSGIPHKIVSFRYTDNIGAVYNYHDLDGLVQYSARHNLAVEYKNFNYFNFLNNELKSYALKYDCASPQITAYMKMIESFQDATVILSGNFWPHAGKNPSLTYNILGLHRFALMNSHIRVIPFFFSHTQQLAFAFSEDIPEFHTMPSYELKCTQYINGGFDVTPQKDKFSGFELIKDYFDSHTHLVSRHDRIRYASMPSKRIFDIEYRYKLRKYIGTSEPLLQFSVY